MKRRLWHSALVLLASLFIASSVGAGELEDKLIQSAQRGDIKDVQTLLDKGANINMPDSYKRTALMRASDRGHANVVRLLIDRGANINARDNLGGTALMLACMSGKTEVVRVLIDKGADVNVRETGFLLYSALDYAKESKNSEIIRMLKAAGAKE